MYSVVSACSACRQPLVRFPLQSWDYLVESDWLKWCATYNNMDEPSHAYAVREKQAAHCTIETTFFKKCKLSSNNARESNRCLPLRKENCGSVRGRNIKWNERLRQEVGQGLTPTQSNRQGQWSSCWRPGMTKSLLVPHYLSPLTRKYRWEPNPKEDPWTPRGGRMD